MKKLDFEEIITNWGVALTSARHFNIVFDGYNCLTYPTLPGHRNRVLVLRPAPGRSKNFWDRHTAHLPMPALFNTRALEHPASQNFAYLTNGEKSTMAMHSAGILNAVNTFGEGSRIEDAINILTGHRLPLLKIIPDCDRHGIRTAKRWQQIAAGKNLRLQILDLGLYLETEYGMTPEAYHKWDSRDLWLLIGQDTDAFHAALEALPEMDFGRYRDYLSPEAEKTSRSSPHSKKSRQKDNSPPTMHTTITDPAAAYDEWWETVVIPALDSVSPPPSHGKHRHCPNPAHEDRHPSFRISERGIPMCTCGIQNMPHPRETLADWVGAQSWGAYKEAFRVRDESREQEIKELRHFPQGVPDLLRTIFLKLHKPGNYVHKHTPALIVYELWHEAIRRKRMSPEAPVTVNRMTDFAFRIGRDTTEKTIRRGIMQLLGLGFFEETAPAINQRGRPTACYTARPLPEAIKSLQSNLMYRLRENIFRGRIPDRVTAEWFPMLPEETARNLANHENERRTDLYEKNTNTISEREFAYERAVEEMLSASDLYTLLNNHSTPLTAEGTWKNGNEYTRFFYAIQAKPRIQNRTPISRIRAAELLGVSPKTVSSYREEMGIGITPLYRSFGFNATSEVLTNIDRKARWATGWYGGRKLVSTGGNVVEIRPDLEYLDEWMEREISAGHEVTLEVQYSSQEREATEEEKHIFAERIRRRKARAKERYREKQLESLENERTPAKKINTPLKIKAEETCPPKFTQGYIDGQLALNGRDPLHMWAFLHYGAIAGSDMDLIPFLPFINDSSAYKGKKGNKDNAEVSDADDTDADKPHPAG